MGAVVVVLGLNDHPQAITPHVLGSDHVVGMIEAAAMRAWFDGQHFQRICPDSPSSCPLLNKGPPADTLEGLLMGRSMDAVRGALLPLSCGGVFQPGQVADASRTARALSRCRCTVGPQPYVSYLMRGTR